MEIEDEILEYLEEYKHNKEDNLFETIYQGWLKALDFPDSVISLYTFLTETFKEIKINPLNEELGGKTKDTEEILTLVYRNGKVSTKVINQLNFILKQLL